MDKRTSKLIKMWLIDTNITDGCRISTEDWIYPIVFSNWETSIYYTEIQFGHITCKYLPEKHEVLWHPLYIGRVMQWMIDNDMSLIQPLHWACETKLHWNMNFMFYWKDKDWNQNFNLSYDELSEESQDKILDLLCKVY